MKKIEYSIVIIGMTSSGKTTLANEVVKRTRFKKASFGSYLLDYAKQNNFGTNTEDLQIIGQGFIDTDYKSFLNEVLTFSNAGDFVIFEGVRHLAILNEVKHLSLRTMSLYIDTPVEVRFERFNLRETEKISWEKFLKLDDHIVESEIKDLKEICNYALDGTNDVFTLTNETLNFILTGQR